MVEIEWNREKDGGRDEHARREKTSMSVEKDKFACQDKPAHHANDRHVHRGNNPWDGCEKEGAAPKEC